MNKKTIKRLAKQHGIQTLRKTSAELIREIQQAEGNFDCFGSAWDYCDQKTCLFRDNCLQYHDKS